MDALQVPQGAVVITPAQMYTEMQDIGRKVDHLATVMDPALSTLREDLLEVKGTAATSAAERKVDHAGFDRRIAALEGWRWFVLGVATVWGPLGGYVLAHVGK